MAEEPNIIQKLIAFFETWDNPDHEKGKYKQIKPYQLRIYDVSTNFVFKWIVAYSDLVEAAQFIGAEISDNKIYLSIGEYEIELQGHILNLK